LLLLGISSSVSAQSDFYIDSLIIEASKCKNDTNKLNLLNIISENAGDDIWPMYNNELGKLAARLQKSPVPEIQLCAKKHLAASLNNKGFYFSEKGIPYKALIFFNKSLAIQREISDREGEAYSLSNLGTIYDSKGDIYKALEFYFASIKIREKLDNKVSLAQSYNNIAVLYNHQNDLVNSVKYHFQSLKIRKEINDLQGVALAYNNIGSTYTHLIETSFKGKEKIPDSLFSKSLDYFQKGYSYYKKDNDEHGMALALFNIGDHYMLQADCFFQKNPTKFDSLLKISEKLFSQSFKIFDQLNEKEWVANVYNGLANVYWRQKKINEAIKQGEKAMQLAQELGYPETIQNAANILKKIYQERHEPEKALAMSDLYHRMRDSVVNETNKKESLSKYFLYQSEKQQLLAEANQEKMKLSYQAETKQQRLVIYFVIGGLIILSVFGIFMYNRFKVTQKQNRIIHEQKRIVEHQKHIVEESQKEVLDSINYAKRIQYALLANDDVLTQNLQSHFVLFKPKDIVSGNFYWATKHNNKFYLAVCDSTGHGVPGAFMSLLNIGFLSEAIKEKGIFEPHEIFNYVRQRLIESISKEEQQDGMDGILLCIDERLDVITYAAAHNAPVLVRDNTLIELPKDKMPVGKGERLADFNLQSVRVQKGDVLYLYTDGYADQFGGDKGKKFKYKTLNNLLLSINASTLPEQVETLNQTFNDWRDKLDQVDDVLIVGIKI
jgi:serine phosphatase RsbU (regulator of sigma subunit)